MTHARSLGDTLVKILGALFVLIGATLAIGGAWLTVLGGSIYYLSAGVGLIAVGVLLWKRLAAGAALYGALFVVTLAWAFWEVGPNGWALLPRIFAPFVLLVLVLALSHRLHPTRHGARTSMIAAGLSILAFAVLYGAVGLTQTTYRVAHDAAPLADGANTGVREDWPAYGGTYAAQRFSRLNEITPDNVDQLEPVWTFHTGDLGTDETRKLYGSENTPLKVGDTLYLCTPMSIIIAVDAASGAERWRHDPKVPEENIPYTAACRGVAYYAVPDAQPNDPCAQRIILGTLDARLVAVDARTGASCTGFGENGEVDTSAGIGEAAPGMFSITSPPTIVRGVVVIGHQVLDGQKRDAPSGVIQGFDALTGTLRWAWDLGRPELTGLPPDGQTYTRGTPNMWTIASGDEELGFVYLPLGVSSVDYWSGSRSSAEDAFATSLVALDVTSGKAVWHFQTVRIDVWDYDLGSQATLLDFPTDAGPVPALLLPSKRGDIFLLDRRTGALLAGVEDRPVPQGGVEPQRRAATQPYSQYHTLQKPDLTEADMWGMSPIDQMICRIQFRSAAYEGDFTPPTADRRFVQYPGYNGGSDWGGIAVDPSRGLIIANYNDMPNYNRLVPRDEADRLGWAPRGEARGSIGGAEGAGDPQVGTPYAIDVNAGWRMPVTGLLCKQPPYGGIRAIDIRTGATVWDRPFGTARTNGPFGIPSMLPILIGTPNNGGAVTTAGGITFIAAATDNLFRAIDTATGEELWSYVLPGGGQATPMTYDVGGRQYVVITAGGHHFMETPISDAVIAFALPQGR